MKRGMIEKGTDCIVVTKEKPEQVGLRILHVTEGLSFHPDLSKVVIHLDIFSMNTGDLPVRYRVVHRGKTVGVLKRFRFDDNCDPRSEIIAQIFANRIKPAKGDKSAIKFYRRVNCFGVADKPIELSLKGPGSCFDKLGDIISLRHEIEPLGEDCAFSSYLVPPPESPPISRQEASVCTLNLELKGESYEKLVGDGSALFVNSHESILRTLMALDMPQEKNDDMRRLFAKRISPRSAIIAPEEYDIVIFQELGQPVDLTFDSVRTTPGRLPLGFTPSQVLWYYGDPKKGFCLKFAYSQSPERGSSSHITSATAPI